MTAGLQQIIRRTLKIADGSRDITKLLACARAGQAGGEVGRIQAGELDDDFCGTLQITTRAAPLVHGGEMRPRLRDVLLTRGNVGQVEQRVLVIVRDREDTPICDGGLREETTGAQTIGDLREVLDRTLGCSGADVQVPE